MWLFSEGEYRRSKTEAHKLPQPTTATTTTSSLHCLERRTDHHDTQQKRRVTYRHRDDVVRLLDNVVNTGQPVIHMIGVALGIGRIRVIIVREIPHRLADIPIGPIGFHVGTV